MPRIPVAVLTALLVLALAGSASAASLDVVIGEVYGGGGLEADDRDDDDRDDDR